MKDTVTTKLRCVSKKLYLEKKKELQIGAFKINCFLILTFIVSAIQQLEVLLVDMYYVLKNL